MEQIPISGKTHQELLAEIRGAVPQVIETLKPDNPAAAKQSFLADDTAQAPQTTLSRLASYDAPRVQDSLDQLSRDLQTQELDNVYQSAYGAFLRERTVANQLLAAAQDYQAAETPEVASSAAARYQRLNAELYGEPDNETYHNIIAYKLGKHEQADPAHVTARQLQSELLALLPAEALSASGAVYRPSQETIEAVGRMAQAFLEPVLKYVPERGEPYTAQDLHAAVTTIFRQEIGQAADLWEPRFVAGKGLAANPSRKTFDIGEDYIKDAPQTRELTGHEFMHVFRSLMGEQTDMAVMEIGFAGYGDTEEGNGRVIQLALAGKYELSGAAHYMTIGYAQAGHNFRETFEMKWRMLALDAYKRDGGDIDQAAIDKARAQAYDATQRIYKAGLPTNKDLSYYNGTIPMWQYYERYADDELMISLVMLGKINPTNPDDRRIALETRSTYGETT